MPQNITKTMWAINNPTVKSRKGTNVKCNETFKLPDEPQSDDVTNLMSFHIFSYPDFLEKKVYLQCGLYSQVSLC